MERDSLEEWNTPIRKKSKIKNLKKRIFSLFKKEKTDQRNNETIDNDTSISETYSLLDDDMKHVVQAIKNIIAQEISYDADDIYPEHKLKYDLGIDEEQIEYIMKEIWDTLDIPENERGQISDFETVRDIIAYVENHK